MLSGLIYSPNHVDVIAVAPEGYADRFFYALIQLKGGKVSGNYGADRKRRDPTYLRDFSFTYLLTLWRFRTEQVNGVRSWSGRRVGG